MTTQEYLPASASADTLARLHTAEAIGALVLAVRGHIPGIKPADMVRAANDLLDRGHGRAVQAVISVPARVAVSARLAALSEAALLEIARRGARGVGSKTGDPFGAPDAAGAPIDNSKQVANTSVTRLLGNKPDIVDAEFDDVDPLS